jgi:hypothetical protein
VNRVIKIIHHLLPYLPFVVLALAVLVAVWHVNVYW